MYSFGFKEMQNITFDNLKYLAVQNKNMRFSTNKSCQNWIK